MDKFLNSDYKNGFLIAFYGGSLKDCPYDSSTEQYNNWVEGFWDGVDEVTDRMIDNY